MKNYLLISLLLLAGLSFGSNQAKIRINDGPAIAFSRFFTTTMPGDTVKIEMLNNGDSEPVLQFSKGEVFESDKNTWSYIAPQMTGTYKIIISQPGYGCEFGILVFVLRPLSEKKGEYLNGYRVGEYPPGKYRGKNNYIVPEGLIEVTKENKDDFISPHFQLKQFLCKQKSGWPKYILIDPKVISKLEYLVDGLNASGKEVSSIHIMSGYRTPYYNKAIGNVKYSRHIYGDAVDIYVDVNNDSVIDDMNNDGKNNMQDAEVIYNMLDAIDSNPDHKDLLGGLGKYRKNSAHTYFVHTDTRGYKARW